MGCRGGGASRVRSSTAKGCLTPGFAAAMASAAGTVAVRLEPTADHADRLREVGADLSVAGAEPLPGVAAGEADPDPGCADGAPRFRARLPVPTFARDGS